MRHICATQRAYRFAPGASFVCTNQPEPRIPFSRSRARAPAQRQPLRNKYVSPDDPFHFVSVYNENCTKRVRGMCYPDSGKAYWNLAVAGGGRNVWRKMRTRCDTRHRRSKSLCLSGSHSARVSPRDCPHAMTGDTH